MRIEVGVRRSRARCPTRSPSASSASKSCRASRGTYSLGIDARRRRADRIDRRRAAACAAERRRIADGGRRGRASRRSCCCSRCSSRRCSAGCSDPAWPAHGRRRRGRHRLAHAERACLGVALGAVAFFLALAGIAGGPSRWSLAARGAAAGAAAVRAVGGGFRGGGGRFGGGGASGGW